MTGHIFFDVIHFSASAAAAAAATSSIIFVSTLELLLVAAEMAAVAALAGLAAMMPLPLPLPLLPMQLNPDFRTPKVLFFIVPSQSGSSPLSSSASFSSSEIGSDV